MQRLKNSRGFTVVETVLVVALLVAVGAAGYFAYQARQDKAVVANNNDNGTEKAATEPANQFEIPEYKVKMTLPDGLLGLTYKIIPEEKTTNGFGEPMTIPSYAVLISKQLTGKPTTCEGGAAEVARISMETSKPVENPDNPMPADLQKQIAGSYFVLGLPNGGPCFADADTHQIEIDQRAQIQDAFQTLSAL